jgi:hypothetical protein
MNRMFCEPLESGQSSKTLPPTLNQLFRSSFPSAGSVPVLGRSVPADETPSTSNPGGFQILNIGLQRFMQIRLTWHHYCKTLDENRHEHVPNSPGFEL